MILSCLDYGNSLLGALSSCDVQRLQKLQNRAARLIYQADRRTSASPLLRELHWLPVQRRVEFKILVHVYNSFHCLSPKYLQNLLTKYTPGHRGLRSSTDLSRLTILKCKCTYGDKSFSVLGPKLWNSLPANIRDSPTIKSFKKLLKTYLFPKE